MGGGGEPTYIYIYYFELVSVGGMTPLLDIIISICHFIISSQSRKLELNPLVKCVRHILDCNSYCSQDVGVALLNVLKMLVWHY